MICMLQQQKKHRIVSYENLSKELADIFNEKYPRGFNDYLDDLVKYPKADGTSFYAVTIEVPDTVYLVKIKVETDAIEDIENWLAGEEEAEVEQVAGTADSSEAEAGPLPDDNISQYGADDDISENI